MLLAVGDDVLEGQLALAADRGDRSAVVFGSAWSPAGQGPTLRQRLAEVARTAGMAVCGGGCMGFVNLSTGVRALGYLERTDLLARCRRSRVALGLGVLGAAAHSPAHRLDVGRVLRAGARHHDGRLPRATRWTTRRPRAVALLLETLRDAGRLRAPSPARPGRTSRWSLLAVGRRRAAGLVDGALGRAGR